MTSFITRSGPDRTGAYVYKIIVTTDNQEHYEHIQKAARFCIDHMKPQTNGDRFRAMSDEELAVFLEVIGYDSMEYRASYWIDWLKQPYKEDT